MSFTHGQRESAAASGSAGQGRKADKDWQLLRERLAQIRLVEPQGVGSERAQAILVERARILARVPAQATQDAEVVEVLVMMLGQERCALPTEHIREVLRFQEITPLPCPARHVLGIVDVRGQILALFDLPHLLGITAPPSAEAGWILVLGDTRAEFGVLADQVFEVARLRTDEIFDASDSVPVGVRPFLRGVTEKALLVLDGRMLLEDPRLFLDPGDDEASTTRERQS